MNVAARVTEKKRKINVGQIDRERMDKALKEGSNIRLPDNLSREEMRAFILSHA